MRHRVPSSIEITRGILAIMVTVLVGIVAVIAIPYPSAASVLQQLLPLLTLVLGYFFGAHSAPGPPPRSP